MRMMCGISAVLSCRLLTSTMLILVGVGCGAGVDDSPSGFAARDSAGIRIVENAASAWGEGDEWRLSAEPVVHIGAVEGADHYLFSEIRDAARFPDGRIAVANRGSNQIRIFDERGTFLRALGGTGGGPGEFERLTAIEILPGDSILAYDYTTHRLTVFGPEGEVARTATIDWESMALASGLGRLSDGTLVLRTGSSWSSRQLTQEERRVGLFYRAPSPILRYTAEGVLLDTIGVFPGLEIAVWEDDGITMGVPWFAHMTVHDAYQNQVYVGTQETYEIRVYSSSGDLRRLIRGPPRDLTVTDEDMRALRQWLQEAAPADMPNRDSVINAVFTGRPVPETAAAYAEILVDAAGNLWVAEATPSGMAPTTVWTVFDPDGRMLGTVSVPDRFGVSEIGEDYVLGQWQDQFDVQYVRMYALRK